MNHNDMFSDPGQPEAAGRSPANPDQDRLALATRIHDLLMLELGQDVDVALMLGPPEYARAVLSLCRSCGGSALAEAARHFEQSSAAHARLERDAQQRHLTIGALNRASAPLPRGVAGSVAAANRPTGLRAMLARAA
jgi:hypothetical protein